MKIKQLLTKTLLVAVCLLAGQSAWASILSPSAGKDDNSTAWNTWDESFTQNYTMSGNSTASFTFHYTSDPTASDYAGWTMFIGKTINTTNVWDTWISCRGYDGTYYGAEGLGGTRASSNTYAGTLSAASCTEADVTVTITRTAESITAVAAVDPTNGDDDYTITWTYTYGGSDVVNGDLYISFAVEKAYLNITNVSGPNVITTTQADIDFSNPITDGSVQGTVNSMAIGATTSFNTEIAGEVGAKYLFLGDGINTVTIPSEQYAGKKDVVTIQFDMAIADGKDNHAAFYIQDADGANIGYMKCALWSSGTPNETNLGIALNTTTFNKNSTSPKDALWDKRTSFTITIDYLNNTITTVSQIQGSSALDPIVVSLTNKNPVAKFVIQAWPSTGAGGAERRAKFGNLLIKTTKGDYSVETAEYTVNWKVGDEVVKTDTRSGDVGSSVTLLAADKEKFFNGENTKKYSYISDDSSEKTIAEDGSTVITITCEEVGKFNYSVTTSVGSIIEEGTLYNDETKKISWSKYIEKDGKYYIATDPFQFTVTKDAATKEVSVTESLVIQFVEATSGNWASTGESNGNLSGGIAYRGVTADGTKTMLTVAEDGIYSINYAVFSTNTGNAFNFSLYKNDASISENKIDEYKVDYSINYVLSKGTQTVDNVLLAAGDKIIAKSGSTTCALDYIALIKTHVPVTIASSGYSSLGSAYGLDFANATTSTNGAAALTAFAATESSETSVKLVSIDEAPAATGVILKGTPGATYTIPVKANAAALTVTNLLHAAVTATDIEANTSYIMQGGQFHLVTEASKVPAGKAYLQAATTGAKALTVVFADDLTGVANVNAAEAVQPVKRIVNGQLVIEKNGKRNNAAGAEF